MKKVLCVLILLFLCIDQGLQAQNIFCKKTQNQFSNLGCSMAITNDGGCIIAGSSSSITGNGSYDAFIFKLDSLYNQEWSVTYGDSGDDKALGIIQTYDGGYAVTGLTHNPGVGSTDIFLLKLDTAGQLQWSKFFGGSATDWGFQIMQGADSSLIINGLTSSYGKGASDAYTVKFDSIGNLLWSRTNGGPQTDIATGGTLVSDGVVVCGTAGRLGKLNGLIYKLNNKGNLLWSKVLITGEETVFYSIAPSNDGGFMMAGYCREDSTLQTKSVIAKTDSIGNMIWIKRTGYLYEDRLISVCRSQTGFYYGSGFAVVDTNPLTPAVFRIFKWDDNGTILWSKAVNNCSQTTTGKILESPSGEILVIGTAVSEVALFAFDYNGNGCCSYDFNTPDTMGGRDTIFGTVDSGIAFTSYIFVSNIAGQWTTDCITTSVPDNLNSDTGFEVFPNPTKDGITIRVSDDAERSSRNTIKLRIMDLPGREVYTALLSNLTETRIDIGYLQKGIYLIELQNNGVTYSKKLVKE